MNYEIRLNSYLRHVTAVCCPVATRWIWILDFGIYRGSVNSYFVKFGKYAVVQANVWHEDSDRQIEHDASPSKGTVRPLSIGIPQAA